MKKITVQYSRTVQPAPFESEKAGLMLEEEIPDWDDDKIKEYKHRRYLQLRKWTLEELKTKVG